MNKPESRGRGPMAPRPPASAPPASGRRELVPVRVFAIPELRLLQELRGVLARGGMPPLEKRTPEDSARLGAYRVIAELLQFFGRFKSRVEAGERCRLVEVEHGFEPGRLVIELAIESLEVQPVAGAGRHADRPLDPDLAGSFACRPVPATPARGASSVGEGEGT